MAGRAVILFGHGSRDPLWRQPIEAVAARLAAEQPALLVRCAYLELEAPDLPAATAELAALGARAVRIVPMFLGMGRHARQDLPALVQRLRQTHPEVRFTLAPAVGEHPEVTALLARIAAQ
jgi:sirohydrochlorin cobaltochelatase